MILLQKNKILLNNKRYDLDSRITHKVFIELGYSPSYARQKFVQFKNDVGKKRIYTISDLYNWINS